MLANSNESAVFKVVRKAVKEIEKLLGSAGKHIAWDVFKRCWVLGGVRRSCR